MSKRDKYKTKDRGGRPKKHIDKALFENLCRIQCTKEEIGNVLEVDEKTITRFCKEEYGEAFKDVWEMKSAPGKMSLRRWQFKVAENGNPTMLVWLGKQYLNQSDKQDLTHDGGLNIGIDWVGKDGK